MLKSWRWLALVGLTLAACSSGTADSGSPATTVTGVSDRAARSASSSNELATTVVPTTSTTAVVQSQTVEYTTSSGKTRLKVVFPASVSTDEMAILEAYVEFLRLSDEVGDQPDASHPAIDLTTTAGVRDRLRDTAARLARTGQVIRGWSSHVLKVQEIYPDKTQVRECVTDWIGQYAWDGSAVFEPSGNSYPVVAFLVNEGERLKVRSYITYEEQSCVND